MFILYGMKTYKATQALGFFDVELRVQWLRTKGNPLSRLDTAGDAKEQSQQPTVVVNWFEELKAKAPSK